MVRWQVAKPAESHNTGSAHAGWYHFYFYRVSSLITKNWHFSFTVYSSNPSHKAGYFTRVKWKLLCFYKPSKFTVSKLEAWIIYVLLFYWSCKTKMSNNMCRVCTHCTKSTTRAYINWMCNPPAGLTRLPSPTDPLPPLSGHDSVSEYVRI